MPHTRFDTLVMNLATASPRRALLKAAGAATIGGLLGLHWSGPVAARGPGFKCVSGFNPCRGPKTLACCAHDEVCCDRGTDHPTCAPSKEACPS